MWKELTVETKDLEILNQMGTPASVHETPKLVRMLIYADYGHGKTTLAAQIAEVIDGPVCMVTTDSNWVIVNKIPGLAERTYRYAFDSFAQVRLIVQAHEEGIEPYASYRTLIWDTVSTSVDSMLATAVKNKKYNDQRDPEVPSWTHYNLISLKMKETVEVLNKSDLNVIYLTHVREPNENDRAKKKFAIRSNMPEKTFEPIAREVQAIGWLHRDEKNQIKIQFNPTNQETAKTQIPTIEEKTYLASEVPELVRKWIVS